MSLTIAIPTYSRCEEVLELLDDLADLQKQVSVNVLICNDCGPEEIHKRVSSHAHSKLNNLQIHRNKTNIGIDRNIDRCFRLPSTEFVFVVGEDDRIDVPETIRLVRHLKKFDGDLLIVEYSYIFPDGQLLKEKIIDASSLDSTDFLFNKATKLGFIGSVVFRRLAYATYAKRIYLGTYFNHVGTSLELLFRQPEKAEFYAKPVVLNRAADMSITSWSESTFGVVHGWWEMVRLFCESTESCSFELYRQKKSDITFQYDDFRWILSRRADGLILLSKLPEIFRLLPLRASDKVKYLVGAIVPRFLLQLAKRRHQSMLSG